MALTTEGSKYFFTSTFGTAKNITAITNASPAVATSAAHGFVDNDELLYIGGWEDATNSIYRADQLTADTVALTGLNATNANYFAAGSGTGTIQKASNWIEIPEILTFDASGGTQKFIDLQLINSRYSRQIPTGFDPSKIDMSLVFSPGNAAYQSMLDITMSRTLVGFKMQVGSAAIYAYGYLSAGKAPKAQAGQVMSIPVTFNIQGQFTPYI